MSEQLIYDFVLDPDFVVNHINEKDLLSFLQSCILAYSNRLLVAFPDPEALRKRLAAERRSKNISDELSFSRILDLLGLTNPELKVRSRHIVQFNESKSWIKNLIEEDKRLPVHAVLTDGRKPFRRRRLGIEPYSPLINVQTLGIGIKRDAVELAAILAKLYAYSSKLAFIDRYFNPDDKNRRRFLEEQFRSAMSFRMKQKPLEELTIHTELRKASYGSNSAAGYEPFCKAAKKFLPDIVPEGQELKICFWREQKLKKRRPRFHNRYIVTENFGIHLGDSQEVSYSGSDDDISLQEKERHSEIWWRFRGDNQDLAYERTHDPIVISGKADYSR